MIDRYCLENMKNIWDISSKFSYYLKVELAVCDAYYELEEIPREDYKFILDNAKIDLKRIDEIEAEVKDGIVVVIINIFYKFCFWCF